MKKTLAVLAILLALALPACCHVPSLPRDTAAALTALPTAARTASPAASLTAKPTAKPTQKPQPSKAQILSAFRQVAFASEYGSSSSQIRKWTKKMTIAIHGEHTQQDTAALKAAMDGLNKIDGFPGIATTKSGQNVDFWFVPLSEMDDVIPEYVQGNWGFFYTHFDSSGIKDAAIAIATDVTDQEARTHLIFEELLQSTGLMQDYYDDPDSIFYGEWTTVQRPTQADWELLWMLYLPGLKQGMSMSKAITYLENNYQPWLSDGK